MLYRKILYICIIHLVGSQGNYPCRVNEKYSKCSQPAICMTCTNPRRCQTYECIGGCDCIKGYYRNNVGTCIPWFQCRAEKNVPCPINEVFSKCAQPKSCMTCTSPQICQTFTCNEGCNCKQDYYRNEQGICIPSYECPFPVGRQCPPNEVYSKCAQPKGCMTCESPWYCATLLCQPGCNCTQGYFRDEAGACVPYYQCPNPERLCGENETYYDAVPDCKNTCEHYGNPGIRCAFGPPGCFCKEGFVQNNRGRCVRYEECEPPKTNNYCQSDKEEYSTCGSHCPLTCDNYNKSMACILSCAEGCFCKRGLVRNQNNECVPPSQCNLDNLKCNENEEIVSCAKPAWCNTCDIRGNCKLMSCGPGCDCKPNHYRDDRGVCVPESECYIVN